jgi:hypothetical protein
MAAYQPTTYQIFPSANDDTLFNISAILAPGFFSYPFAKQPQYGAGILPIIAMSADYYPMSAKGIFVRVFLGSILLVYIGNWFGYPVLFLIAGLMLLLGFGVSRFQTKLGQAAHHISD